jgi:chromosome segregation ATPase
MAVASILFLLAAVSTRPAELASDTEVLVAAADHDMVKLNDFIQADKENEVNVERLYADLQQRFTAIKTEATRGETERSAMRRALMEARQHAQKLSEENARLTDLVTEVRKEQSRISEAKSSVLRILGMAEGVNLTAEAHTS